MGPWLQTKPSKLLSPRDFQARFDEAMQATRLSSRKVEALQYYNETGDPSWERLQEGDWDGAVALLASVMAEERAELEPVIRRGVKLTRLRIIERPLTAYVRWEFESYKLSMQLGEEIRVLDAAQLRDDESLPDFILFDSDVLITLDYSPDGRYVAAHEFGPSGEIDKVIAVYDRLMRRATPLKDFFIAAANDA
jgi:hypothetical protein